MMDNQDKIIFVRDKIRNEITEAIPPAKKVAMTLWLYGITEKEFSKMKKHLDVSIPIFVKIQNHLRDEWRHQNRVLYKG